jgi:hypothetical protein
MSSFFTKKRDMTTTKPEAVPRKAVGSGRNIQSYRNDSNHWLHIDKKGLFFERNAQPLDRACALGHAQESRAITTGDKGCEH